MITQTNPLKPKKKRSIKGKKPREREETDRERRERLMPGSDDLKKLSLGIPEGDEPEDDCLIDDEINDDPEGDEDDCLIPMKWAMLATNNPDTQKAMKRTIQEARTRKKKKERKKNCEPGNVWHKSDGTFGSAGSAASWSIGNQDGVGRDDCQFGKARKSGSGRSIAFTKRECGRKDVTDPNVKAKFRCRDGSVVKEQDEDSVIDAAWEKTTNEFNTKISDRLQKVLDRDPNFIKHLSFIIKPLIDMEHQSEREPKQSDYSRYDDKQRDKPQSNDTALVGEKKNRHKGLSREQIRNLCARSGFFGWTDFLMKLSAIEQAKKGTINRRGKDQG